MYTVCIQAAGVGSRLTICDGLHKALIPINKKSILSRIIDLYPSGSKFIILVGYKKEQIKSFLDITYPNLNVEYVEVKKFRGVGSGPGYSLLQAKNHLNCPFIFMACDTIVLERPPLLSENWIGISASYTSKEYLVAEVVKSRVSRADKKDKEVIFRNSSVYQKKEQPFDAFIGLAGVYDYEVFWNALEKQAKSSKEEIQVTWIRRFNSILHTKTKKFTWVDTGTDISYSKARNFLKIIL